VNYVLNFKRWPGALLRAIVIFCSVTTAVHGQSGFELKPIRETSFIGAGLILHGTSIFLEHRNRTAPAPVLNFDRIPGIDRLATRLWHPTAHKTSNILFGVALAASFATAIIGDEHAKPLVPIVIIASSGFLASGLTNTVKELVRRPRPYLYNSSAPTVPFPSNNDQLSFWSGHTANTAALTFACASMVQRSDASAGAKTVTWIGAALAPAAMGYLRVRAGRHFPTDVLTGYAVGALIGLALPYFHRLN